MSRRGSFSLTLVLMMGAVLAGGVPPVDAQADTTTTPTSTSTTVAPATTTTAPPATTSTAPPVPTTAAPPPPAPAEAPSLGPEPDSGPVTAPPDLPPQSVTSSYIPSGSNSTAALLEALRALEGIGFSPEEAALAGMGQFPLAGYATYSDDWHAPRGTPEAPRQHMGTDIFSAFGTRVRAPADGVVRFSDEGLGGKAATLTTSDGTYYYMAHLMGFAPDVASGASVEQGQVIGFNGDSGNAKGGSPHVHFEVHPAGGAAVNPKPILDTWLAEALAAAQALASSYQEADGGARSSILNAISQVRRFDDRSAATPPPSETAPLLWASSVSPAGSALRLAEIQAERAAGSIDWDLRANQARRRTALLTPITPAPIADVVTHPN